MFLLVVQPAFQKNSPMKFRDHGSFSRKLTLLSSKSPGMFSLASQPCKATVVTLAETTVSNKARYSNQSALSPPQTPMLELRGLGSTWGETAVVASNGTPDCSIKCGYPHDVPGSQWNKTCECLKCDRTGDRTVHETLIVPQQFKNDKFFIDRN